MFVIKLGGALGADLVNVCDDVQALAERGEHIVIVHGGSDEANRLGERLGQPPRYLHAPSGMRSRYTDAATIEILTMAMVGSVKPRVVVQLLRRGVRAIGLSGLDGRLISAEKTPPVKALVDGRARVVRDDLTGRISAINTELLRLLLDAGYLPVISPPVIDPEAGPLNTDADRLASALAVALKAEYLITLSNVPGLLRDLDDPNSLVSNVAQREFGRYLELAHGRMRVKLLAANDALAGGVAHVILSDGRLRSPLRAALAGSGTTLTVDALTEETRR